MTDPTDPIRLLDNAPARRLWLLAEAVRSVPFDRALDLARSAEAFLVGCEGITNLTSATEPGPQDEQFIAPLVASHQPKRSGIALAENQRDRLLDRLAEGARNAELAAEFGLSAKQVQGVRMGCAREIAERARRTQRSPAAADRDQVTTPTSSIDEIVRYLRQQDDVVVPQEDDGYLVNGRFRMSAAELTLRANRMRYRQGRPAFDTGNAAFPDHANAAPKGHPLFWEQAAATDPAPNGFHRPADIDTEGA
jgi:hypothetical protein